IPASFTPPTKLPPTASPRSMKVPEARSHGPTMASLPTMNLPCGLIDPPTLNLCGSPRSTRTYRRSWKTASTSASETRSRAQGIVEHAPRERENFESAPGLAESVTRVPSTNSAAHVPGQSIPGGSDATLPRPSPVTCTMTRWGGSDAKDAATLASAASFSEQAGPAHAPPKPSNLNPAAGVARSVTEVPSAKVVEQRPGHSIPGGSLFRMPDPTTSTARRCCEGGGSGGGGGAGAPSKVAATEIADS